nr:hypothetical protein [Tanacetum cinerariifolium]
MPSIPLQEEVFWIRFHENVCQLSKANPRLDIQEVELPIREQTRMLLFLLLYHPILSIFSKLLHQSLNDMKASFVTPTAPIKAVEE